MGNKCQSKCGGGDPGNSACQSRVDRIWTDEHIGFTRIGVAAISDGPPSKSSAVQGDEFVVSRLGVHAPGSESTCAQNGVKPGEVLEVTPYPCGIHASPRFPTGPGPSNHIGRRQRPTSDNAGAATFVNARIEAERKHLKRLFVEFVQEALQGRSSVRVVDPPGPAGEPYTAVYSLDGRLGTFTLKPMDPGAMVPSLTFQLLHLDTSWRAGEFPKYWDALKRRYPTTLGRLPSITTPDLDLASICILDYSVQSEDPIGEGGVSCLAFEFPDRGDTGLNKAVERTIPAKGHVMRRLCLIEEDAYKAERLVEAMTLLRLYNEDAGW